MKKRLPGTEPMDILRHGPHGRFLSPLIDGQADTIAERLIARLLQTCGYVPKYGNIFKRSSLAEEFELGTRDFGGQLERDGVSIRVYKDGSVLLTRLADNFEALTPFGVSLDCDALAAAMLAPGNSYRSEQYPHAPDPSLEEFKSQDPLVLAGLLDLPECQDVADIIMNDASLILGKLEQMGRQRNVATHYPGAFFPPLERVVARRTEVTQQIAALIHTLQYELSLMCCHDPSLKTARPCFILTSPVPNRDGTIPPLRCHFQTRWQDGREKDLAAEVQPLLDAYCSMEALVPGSSLPVHTRSPEGKIKDSAVLSIPPVVGQPLGSIDPPAKNQFTAHQMIEMARIRQLAMQAIGAGSLPSWAP